jgi:hypothetical protein
MRLAPDVHSLSLMGVNLSDAKVEEIVAHGYKRVLLSLDNDATYAAIKLQLKYRRKIKGLEVAGLQKDIKDMTTGEFDDYLLHFVL